MIVQAINTDGHLGYDPFDLQIPADVTTAGHFFMRSIIIPDELLSEILFPGIKSCFSMLL